MFETSDAQIIRKAFEAKEEAKKNKEKIEKDPIRQKRESDLIRKVCEIFIQREISFYDAFENIYDPLRKEKNIIQISKFK